MRLKSVFAALLLLSINLYGVPVLAEEEAGESPELPTQLLDPEIDTDELTLRLVPLTKDELAALASEWLSIVQDKTKEVVEAQFAISKTEGSVEQQARQRFLALAKERQSLFDKFSTIVNNLEKKGGEESAITEYRAYQNAILVEETRTTDFRTLMAQAWSWLTDEERGIALGKDAAIVLLSLFGLLLLAGLVRKAARRSIAHIPNLSKLLQVFLVTVIYWLVIAIGLMIVLSALGVDISPLFALLAGATFILAFAFQDTLSNFASGLMIMINRPFDEGDYVDFGGVAGTVKSVNVVATKVTTPDNQVIVIPNKQVWGNTITNVTASPTRRVDLVFGISYEDSIADALRVIEETVKAHPLVLQIPEPVIKVHELAESSVNFVCRPWVKRDDYWAVYWDLTRQVKERFDKAGISIPYPQQEIHVKTNAEMATSGRSSAVSALGH